MSQHNVLIILADEFARDALGCAGHPVVQTPRLDRIAAEGTRFAAAYCNSPICVPSRAALHTGRYVHQIRCWDSAEPYDGAPDGWGQMLRRAGHRVASIGKLHFRSSDRDNGFDPEILPLHVKDGVGWLPGLLRRPLGSYPAAAELAAEIGPGETAYHGYDRAVRDAACRWLRAVGGDGGAPWVLFVSFVSPHFPLVAPPEAFARYRPDDVPWPTCYAADQRPTHPAVREMLRFFDYDAHFDAAAVRTARAAYYGLVSFVDGLIGEVIDALAASGAADRTLVVFTSDHGEMLGDHGVWTKQVMYEGSVGVPLILRGPGVPAARRVVRTPCSLVDLQPTILAAAGGASTSGAATGPGRSLLDLATAPDEVERPVFAEYHDGGSVTGAFMLRQGRWKLVHHEGYRPQLFDLEADPDEAIDRAADPDCAAALVDLDAALRGIVDPGAANAQAFADQAAVIRRHGGVAAVARMAEYAFGYSPVPSASS